MILIALGANLPSRFGSPPDTFAAVLSELDAHDVIVKCCSSLWKTAPVPVSDQPWYYNQVVEVSTELAPLSLLQKLHDIEAEMGRTREVRNEARVIDLDLIAYNDCIMNDIEGAVVPHPRMHERLFVLGPMHEIAPHWRHPVIGLTVNSLLNALEGSQEAEREIK